MTQGKPRISVTAVGESHYPALATFFHESWGSDPSVESVAESRRIAAEENPIAPGKAPPTVAALEGDRVIGYCSSLPLRLWDGRQEHKAYWAKGLMVLPEYRNGPIGFHVVRELARHIPLGASLTVNPASNRLFGALGFRDLGAIPNFVHPISLRSMLPRLDLGALRLSNMSRRTSRGVRFLQRSGLAWLAGAVGDLGFGLLAAGRRAPRGFSRSFERPLASEIDGLWERSRAAFGAGAARDGVALLARYRDTSTYSFAVIRRSGLLAGLAVLRVPRTDGDPRLKGLRVVAMSDLLYPAEEVDAGLAILAAARDLAKRLEGDAILASASHFTVTALLRRSAYFRFRGNVHFFLRTPEGAPDLPESLGRWWITRGDGNSDESF